jgi:RHS repeat-associated protein
MSLSVSTSTNRVTSGGATYDGAGNLTSDGTNSYSFDEMNRLIAAGSMSYAYSATENKRLFAYNNSNPSSPTAVLNLYGPSGQRLSSFAYAYNGSSWTVSSFSNLSNNYLYLGNKPLNYSDDRVGSNVSGMQYFPYGQVQSGTAWPEAPTFGTYIQDESGLLYADQRYMYQNWGRFLTADPSDKNISPTSSLSWNRYVYANGDPVNRNDPSGRGCGDFDNTDDADLDCVQLADDDSGPDGGPGGDDGQDAFFSTTVTSQYCPAGQTFSNITPLDDGGFTGS